MQNNLRLAVHYNPAHPSKPWMVGVEIGPGKLQVLDRKLRSRRIAYSGTCGYREHHKTSSSRISAVRQRG
jgi:hypothetical protein